MIDNLTRRREVRFIKEARIKLARRKLTTLNSLYKREYTKPIKPIKSNRFGYIIIIKESSLVNLKYSSLLGELKDCVNFLNDHFKYKLTYLSRTTYLGMYFPYIDFGLTEKEYKLLSLEQQLLFVADKLNYSTHYDYVLSGRISKHLTFKRVKLKLDYILVLDRQKESLKNQLRKGFRTGEYRPFFNRYDRLVKKYHRSQSRLLRYMANEIRDYYNV